MENDLENNLLMFYCFFKFIKKNENQIWQVRNLKDDEIEKKNLIL
jgi:hypothetical protein